MSEKPTLKQILPQLQSWCAVNNVSVQSVYDECHGMTLQEIVYYLLGVVREAVNQVVENTDAFNELENKFNNLYNFVNNYFDNLDVQEEINNKLDEMFKSGQLNELLKLFIPYVTPQMFGAKGDGETDDTTAINNACDTGIPVIIPKTNKFYLITSPINVQNDFINYGELSYAYSSQSGNWGTEILNLNNISNIKITGGILNGNRNLGYNMYDPSLSDDEYGHGISLKSCKNITIENIEIKNCQGDGICLEAGKNNINNSFIVINNCNIHDNYRQGISFVGAENSTINNSNIHNNLRSGINFEPYLSTSKCINVKAYNNDIHLNNGNCIEIYCANENTGDFIIIEDNNIINNSNLSTGSYAIFISATSINSIGNITINNNTIQNTTKGQRTISTTGINTAINKMIISNNNISGVADSSRLQITAGILSVFNNIIPSFIDANTTALLCLNNIINNTNDTTNPIINVSGNVFIIESNIINCRTALVTSVTNNVVVKINNNQISYSNPSTAIFNMNSAQGLLEYLNNHDNINVNANTFIGTSNIKVNMLYNKYFYNQDSSPNFNYDLGDIILYNDPITTGYIGRVYNGTTFVNFGKLET